MFSKLKFPPTLANRVGILIALASIVVLAAACASPAAPSANPVAAPVNTAPAVIAAVAPTEASGPAIPSSKYPDACTVLTQDAVSKVLGTPVDTAVSSGLGGVCTYTSTAAHLSVVFTIAGHTGGIQAMQTTLANLGNLALVVTGLGDQAFYNTNSANALFVLKGDAEYLFGMSDTTYQPLDPAVIQATEKSLAEQLLSNLY